jgi:hypothetical protein
MQIVFFGHLLIPMLVQRLQAQQLVFQMYVRNHQQITQTVLQQTQLDKCVYTQVQQALFVVQVT